LRDPASKVCGRLDFIESTGIVDFKNGEQKDFHVDQIVFYAALCLACTGKLPHALRLVYTTANKVVDVPVPGASSLKALLGEYREQATSFEEQVVGRKFPAKPEPDKCAICNVRGLCEEYWQVVRDSEGTEGEETVESSRISDYTPSTAACIELGAQGAFVRDRLGGFSSCLHLDQETVQKAGDNIQRVRVLSVRAIVGSGSIRFAFTQNSELYLEG
jgi:hypothetical protein